MPTIDDLPAATSVSDTDELLLSQSDITRKATRAQILSGVQPAIGLNAGMLLGRQSAGFGAPEPITIGANLTLSNATLSAPAAFVVSDLSNGAVPAATDLVPIGQGGENAAISFATFAAGLAAIPGLDVSCDVATPAGGIGARTLENLFADAIAVESYGAVGDGATDDTSALNAAFASGRAVRLSDRTYAVQGPLTIAASTVLAGLPSRSVIRRIGSCGASDWITLTAPVFEAVGVTFDAAGIAVGNSAVFEVAQAATLARFTECVFSNAAGTGTGTGLAVNAGMTGVVVCDRCQFTGNAADGLHVAGAGKVFVDACVSSGNGGSGIFISGGVACSVRRNDCSANQVGIGVGGDSAAIGTPANGVTTVPCRLEGNACHGNASWGLIYVGAGGSVCDNVVSGNGSIAAGGGMAVRASGARVTANRVDSGAFGIDARTSNDILLSENYVSNAAVGIAGGACQHAVIARNLLLQNGWGISVNAFEPSLSVSEAGPVTIDRNWIGFTTAIGGGISVLDGAEGVSVTGNDVNGWGSAIVGQALWLHTDAVVCRDNRWNNTAQYQIATSTVAGVPALVFPDTADDVLVTSAPPGVNAVLSQHQVATLGQITFIRVTAGGQGYTQASITISGAGSGASANAVCANGSVVGAVIQNPGSGYGSVGAGAAVQVIGDGSGAAAIAYVGLPVPNGRALRLVAGAPLRLTLAGSAPRQQSWSQYDLSVPTYGCVDLIGVFGGWYAAQSPPVDYVAPTGDGGAILQSVGGGNLVLRPSAGGALCLTSQAEPVGCTSTVGRGAPTGMLAAPPGSDFRNLDGGAGNTFWIKCSGTDSGGWVAVA